MSTSAAALDLHRRGLPVLPLDGKRPHVGALRAVQGAESWSTLRQRPASPVEIVAWFEHAPAANVGVVVPAGVVVVDVDRPELFAHTHPPTPSVATGRGRHLYFRGTVEGVVRTPWGELRGTGSYVVAPPSIHPDTGTAYRWEITPELADLAELPSWAEQYVESATTRSDAPRTNVGPRSIRSPSTARRPDSDLRAVAAAMRRMGRPEAIDAHTGRTREVRCLLPEHHDRRPSAGLYLSAHGTYRYRCHGCGANLSLARLFASVVSGLRQPDTMPAPTAARWLDRLWHEAGVKPVDVPPLDLPADLSRNAGELAAGFLTLGALRAARGDTDPLPYTWAFASVWCGLSRDTAKRALRELRAAGWLVPVGPSRPGVGFLYRPPDSAQPAPGDRLDGEAGSGVEVVAEHVEGPDRALTLEPPRLLVGVQPLHERGHVGVMDGAQLRTVARRAPTACGRAHVVLEAVVVRRGGHAPQPTRGQDGRQPSYPEGVLALGLA